MHKTPFIVVIMAVFLAFVSFPFWGGGKAQGSDSSYELPTKAGYDQCVESKDYMRAHHMSMLDDWRDEVVRDGDHIYTSSDGRQFRKSLSSTCMACHTREENFCASCHTSANVSTNCWSCHNKPDGSHRLPPPEIGLGGMADYLSRAEEAHGEASVTVEAEQ